MTRFARTSSCVFLLWTSATACGSAAPAEDPAPVGDETTGGEAETPVTLRTTTPVPVPQPAIEREQLSEPVQTIWTRTEEIVADQPPDPPLEATADAIAAWSEDRFAPWLAARQGAIQEIEPLVDAIGEDDVQRAVAGGLFGYVYEDTAAGIRGAPIPAGIATDPELLDIYGQTLEEALRPFAQRALESYAYCATTFARLQDEAWFGWGSYCLERARDVNEVFRLGAGGPEADPRPEPESQAPASSQ